MPIGSYSTIPFLANQLLSQRPRTILDLGIGFGMTGAVVRQWLDSGYKPFETSLQGVEIWPQYRSPLWDLYDVVYVQSIEEHLQTPGESADLIVLSDVLEHFEFAHGERVIQLAQQRLAADGVLMISTPAEHLPQGPVYGNPHEEHRSLWNSADFVRRGFEIVLSQEDVQLPPAVPTLIARWKRSAMG